VIVSWAPIVTVKVALAVFEAESVTVTPKLGVPAVVGFPLITPAAERVSPPGRVEPLETAQVYPDPEPPAAASVCA
jgi:hypothetical protein